MKKITINTIHCEHQITDPGDDDLFILVQLDGAPPVRHKIIGTYSMEKGDSASPNAEFYFETNAYISLWDRDGLANFINAADMCGTFNILSSIENGSYTYWTLGDHNACYKMEFTIEDASSLPVSQTIGNIANGAGDALAQLQTKVQTILDGWADMNEVLGMTETSDLNDALSGAVSGGLLDDVISFLQDPSIVSVLPVKALSLGVMGQVEIFTGISGNFGCAADLANLNPENFDDNYSIFAGGGFVEGADAGFDVAVAVGIWFDDVTSIGGWLVGGEIDVSDGGGLSGVAYGGAEDEDDVTEFAEADSDRRVELAKVIFLGVDIGIDDGVEGEETYFFAGHLESAQVSQSGDYDHQATLQWVTCKSMDKDDKDQVHFHFYADGDDTQYRYPIWNDVEMNDNVPNGGVNPTTIYTDPGTGDPSANNMKTYRPGGQMIQFNDYFDIHLHVNDKETKVRYHLSDFDSSSKIAVHQFEDGDKYHYELKFLLVK